MQQKLGPFLVLTAVIWMAVLQGPALFYGTTTAKREAQARIQAGEPLILMEFSEQEYDKIQRPGAEFELDGVMYDVVELDRANGRIRVRAFRDDRETVAAKRMRKLFQRRPEPQNDFPQWAQSWLEVKFLVDSSELCFLCPGEAFDPWTDAYSAPAPHGVREVEELPPSLWM